MFKGIDILEKSGSQYELRYNLFKSYMMLIIQ